MKNKLPVNTKIKQDENGELFIEIPDSILKELGWDIDEEELNLEITKDGIIISKK